MLVCASFCAQLHTRPRVQRAPGLPCALDFERVNEDATLGLFPPRERGIISSFPATACARLTAPDHIVEGDKSPLSGWINGQKMPDASPSKIEARLKAAISGDVFFDPFNRGRYATDASFYQIMPFGVVVPRSMDDALRALAVRRVDWRVATPRRAR